MSHDHAIRRVLLLHEYPGGFGGAERYLTILAAGLRGAGIGVAAVVYAADPRAAASFVDGLTSEGVTVALHRGRSWPLSIAGAVRRHEPDLLHWNGIDPFAFRGGSWMLLPWSRPSVLTDHLPMLRTGPHWETTRKLANRRLAAVVVVSEEGAVAARDHWSSPFAPRLTVVANGVPTGDGRLRSTPPNAAAVELLFLGRLEEQKDPGFALDLVEALEARGRDVRLTIAGEGGLQGDLRARVVAAPVLAARVHFAGFVADPSTVFDAAQVLVLPSRFEGLPFTPLEAMAAGLPVVLSDIPPHREIAACGAGALLAPPGEVSAWCTAIEAAVDDLERRSRAAMEHAERFSATRMVAETLRVYKAAVSGE